MFVTECFHNKCFKLSTLRSVYISPGCESDMILSVMTIKHNLPKHINAFLKCKTISPVVRPWPYTTLVQVVNFIFRKRPFPTNKPRANLQGILVLHRYSTFIHRWCQFLAQLLAQQCLCNWSSVNLTFLPNNLRLPGNVPPLSRDLWWKVAVSQ